MPPVTIFQAFSFAQQYFDAGQYEAAEQIYRQILGVAPQNADALNFLGIVLARTGRGEMAVDLMRQSIALQPKNAAYLDNLGTILRDMGRFEEAIDCSHRALAIEPNAAISHCNLANALQDFGRLTEALQSYERALALQPRFPAALLGMAKALTDSGQARRAVDVYRRELTADPTHASAHSALLVNLHYLGDASAHAIFAEHQRWNRLHASALRQEWPRLQNDPQPDRRLRIAYVSPDFRDHPIAFFIEGLLTSHDRSAVEVFCYSSAPRTDAVTQRLRSHTDQWRDISHLGDADAATLIRQDAIDILVDLAGHTAGHRLLVFARRPAPVQITYLGYGDTTGLEAIDYLLTDFQLDPLSGHSDAHATEQIVRLDDTWTCYRPPNDAPDVSALPAAERGFVTFGSFHTLAKLSEPLLQRWAQILSRVPGSRLLMTAFGLHDPETRSRLRDLFARFDITEDRVEFREWTNMAAYLAMHHEVDILLDSHPFNGHTVSCHALWMGIPLITLTGRPRWSRMGASILRSIGLEELVAESPQRYVDLACDLAGNLESLAELRSTLRSRMSASPLLDAKRFTQSLEQTYRDMWKNWCTESNLSPDA